MLHKNLFNEEVRKLHSFLLSFNRIWEGYSII